MFCLFCCCVPVSLLESTALNRLTNEKASSLRAATNGGGVLRGRARVCGCVAPASVCTPASNSVCLFRCGPYPCPHLYRYPPSETAGTNGFPSTHFLFTLLKPLRCVLFVPVFGRHQFASMSSSSMGEETIPSMMQESNPMFRGRPRRESATG